MPPDPLPEGEPGELIRVMDLGEADGAATVKVMYHSRDGADRDRAVTGLVTYPTGTAPKDGWPVTALRRARLGWHPGAASAARPRLPRTGASKAWP